jgi:hypothetical protein
LVFATDVPVPQSLVEEIIESSDDFIAGRTVALG